MSRTKESWYHSALLLAAIASVLHFIDPSLHGMVRSLITASPRHLSLLNFSLMSLGPFSVVVSAAFFIFLCAESRGWAATAKRQVVAWLGVVVAGIAVVWSMFFLVYGLASEGNVRFGNVGITPFLIGLPYAACWFGFLVMFARHTQPLGRRVTRGLAAALAVLTGIRVVQTIWGSYATLNRAFALRNASLVGQVPLTIVIQLFGLASTLVFYIALWRIGPAQEEDRSGVTAPA